ncbi:hypothetical protein HFN89_02280 [Rhizobium laguerreae]|nr:hypothetical protein [Rhizobium laguerreae]
MSRPQPQLLSISPGRRFGRREAAEVAVEIGNYSIAAARSEAPIAKLLAKQGFAQQKDGSGRVVIDDVEKASDALNLFGGLAAPSDVGSATMHTPSGISVPFEIGQTVEYLKQIDVTTDDKGKQQVVRHLGQADAGIFVSLAPTLRKGGVVDVKIKRDLARVQLKDFPIGGEPLQLLRRQTYSLRTKAKLRADQAAVFVRYVPAEKPSLFKAGEVLVTVIKAKAVK